MLPAPVARVNGRRVDALEVRASLATPWRDARILGDALEGAVVAVAGYADRGTATVFRGTLDASGEDVQGDGEATARGLPAWRATVPPQAFRDATLQTVLGWLAARCGGGLVLAASGGTRRTFALPRVAAIEGAREALRSWGVAADLIELDDGALFVGAEASSPFAREAPIALRRGEEILSAERAGAGRLRVATLADERLRVSSRVRLEHPLYTGAARVSALATSWRRGDTTTRLDLEVVA